MKTVRLQKGFMMLLLLLGSICANAQSITNGSFEDGTNGWTVNKMVIQTNDGMSGYKAGSNYLERWIASGSLVGSGSVKQTVTGLSNGVYRLSAAAMNISQANTNAAQVGAWIVANGLRTAVTTLGTYSLDFFVTDGTAEIGFVAEGASGNWLGCDNFTLTYVGNSTNNISSAGNTVKNYANNLISTYGSDTQYSNLVSTLTSAISGGNLSNVATAAKAVVAGERAYRLRHSSGSAPTVTGNKRTARGSIWIFGRLTWSGSNVVEEGFCYSTSPNPTLENASYTTDWIDSYGKVIWIENLTPGTMYYIRPYAMTKNYAVGYGDVVKVPTLPQGDIHWSIRGSGDETADNHITSSCEWAFDRFWDNLTQLTSYWPSIGHVSGVPTAECSYGGWCSVGDNWAYQNPGTIMHEMLHGVGVGQHWMWGDFTRNQFPVWDALRFWNNDEGATLSGDGMHLWPYGINGAQEDNGSDQLYIGNALVCEALGEGGLPLTGDQWLLPYYAFPQDDNTKYYIKCEDKDRGLTTAYLVVNNSGNLEWQEMSASEAQSNDKAAWYITFDASIQKYHIKNASTNKYIRYNSADATNGFTTGNTASDIQMKKCRVDVNVGSETYNGYTFLDFGSSQAMVAMANGAVGSTGFSIGDDASTQRWIILAAGNDVAEFETGAIEIQLDILRNYINGYTAAKNVNHTDKTDGATTALTNTINTISSAINGSVTMDQALQYIEDMKAAGLDFLNNTMPSNGGYYDLTFLIENADFTDSTEGWSLSPTRNYGAVEFFQTTFDLYQILPNMPGGRYQFSVDAFQRPGAVADVYTAYTGGTDNVNAVIYVNNVSQKIKNIMDGQQNSSISNGEYTTAGNTYVPDNMEAGNNYLSRNKYNNTIQNEFAAGNLRIGLRGTVSNDGYWTMADNFKLYFLGSDGVVVSTKERLVNDGFTQITALPADYSPYFFVLYDHDQDYCMKIKTGVNQGANFKGMWYSDVYPTTTKETLWTIDTYEQDNTTYQIVANATNLDFMYQTEWNAGWNWRCSDNGGGAIAWGRTSFAYNNDGYWTIQNGVYPDAGYLGAWGGASAVSGDAETALNKLGGDIGHFDIFTILRGQFVAMYDNAGDATYESPLDITYVLENPGAERYAIGWKYTGTNWEVQTNNALGGKVGNAYFQRYVNGGVGNAEIYQEIQGLPDGYYRFSAVATCASSGFSIYANSATQTAPTSNTGARASVVVQVTNGTLRVGAKAESVTADWVAFDDAKLEYLGLSIPGYNVGTPTSNITDGLYSSSTLDTWTLAFTDANSNVEGAVFTKLNNSAKATLYKGNTKVGEYLIYLSGKIATVNFSGGVTLDGNSTYTLNFPAGTVGYAGQVSNDAVSVTFTTPTVFDGIYYLRTTDGKYASRGGDWNTRAMVDEFGLPMRLTTNADGKSEFIFVDNNLHLFDAGNGNVYTDNDVNPYWTIQAVTGGYNIKNANDNGTLNYYLSVESDHLQSLNSAYKWTLETLAEHKTRMASLMDTQAATAATAAGITASTKSALEAALANGYREVAIDITGVDGIQEKYQAGAYSIDETVNGLEPGLYKLSVKAFCRMTRNADLEAAGGPASNVYLYAGDVKTQIASLFDAYSDVARVDGNDYQGADGKYYPNGLTAAGMAFNEGQYANDVYFYISSTTNLTFGITNPGRYGNDGSRGAWLAYRDFTLTRYEEGAATDINKDGESDFGDVQALVNIILGRDTTGYDLDAANVDGVGGVTIADITALVNLLLGK